MVWCIPYHKFFAYKKGTKPTCTTEEYDTCLFHFHLLRNTSLSLHYHHSHLPTVLQSIPQILSNTDFSPPARLTWWIPWLFCNFCFVLVTLFWLLLFCQVSDKAGMCQLSKAIFSYRYLKCQSWPLCQQDMIAKKHTVRNIDSRRVIVFCCHKPLSNVWATTQK